MKRLAAMLLILSAGCGGFDRKSQEDFESELTDSLADSLRSVSDTSSLANAGPGFVGGDEPAGCEGAVQVIATEPFCSVTHNAQIRVTWTCVGPNGNGLTGTADIDTDRVPDQCPPTSVAVDQSITLSRHWQFDQVQATLEGTADLSWTADSLGEPDDKALSLALEHKVSKREELLRHQTLAGTRTVAFDENVPGTDADDARVVDGTLSVDFVLADVQAAVTETDLTFRRGCCHPVAGTIDYTLSGNETRSGTITFGPECGRARTDDGRALDLAPCSVD